MNELETDKEPPLVSIITVVYNNRQYLADAMDSIKRQTYPNIEYLVIDGESTDGTVDLIESRRNEIDYYVSEPDGGIYDAMNKGIAAATGRFIGILNSDDWYEDNAIELLVNAFMNDGKIALAHGQMVRWRANGELDGVYGERRNNNMYRRAPFSHPTCLVRADVYADIGTFDCNFSTAADYDFMIRFLISGYKAFFVDARISNFRLVGVTSSTPGPPMKQLYTVLRKNGVSRSLAVYYILRRYLFHCTGHLVHLLGLMEHVRALGFKCKYRMPL